MAGIEAAGLVLAVLAGVVKALEEYDDCSNLARLCFKYPAELHKVETKIKTLDFMYKDLLESTFYPIMSNDERKRFLENPWGMDFGGLEHKLQRFLGERYSVFSDNMKILAEAMKQLVGKLISTGRNRGGAVIASLEDPRRRMRRWSFPFTEGSRKRLLETIESTLTNLQTLGAAHVERSGRQWKRHADLAQELPNDERLSWKRTHVFHKAILRAVPELCRTAHYTDIFLHRNIAFGDNAEIFLRQTMPSAASCKWTLRSPLLRAEHWVRRKQQHVPVEDLCKFISGPTQPATGQLAIPAAESSLGRHIGFTANGDLTSSSNTATVSLFDLLNDQICRLPNRATRLQIATRITKPHLPVHADSWMSASWSIKMIKFPITNGDIDFDRMHLRREAHATQSTAQSTQRSYSMVPLGILLVELCFGNSAENTPIGQAWPFADGRADDSTAALWAAQIRTTIGPGYASAVQWCLKEWPVPSPDLAAEYYREVVAPVEECYRYWTEPCTK